MPPSPGTNKPTTSLANHLAWLESIGQAPGCTCRYAWKSLSYREAGRNVSMGFGWVRLNTAPGCPEHDK